MLHFCMNWTPAIPLRLPSAPLSSRTILLNAFFAIRASRPHQPSPVKLRVRTASPFSLTSKYFKVHACQRVSANSLPCHTSEKSPSKSNHCHTSKTSVCNPCVCHPSETPEGTRVNVHNGRILGGFLRRREMSKKIRTWMVLSLVGAALVYGQAAMAQEKTPDWSKVQIKVTKVSGNIYMLEGQGGNIAASVGEDGIVIVDDQFAPLADKIQAALKELKITDKPVRFVINTHYHGDHTGGNVPFNNAGSTLIAQDNVRKRLETGGTAGNGGSIKMENKLAPKAALPIITFEHDVTVHLNGEDIRALHFPSGHTDGDSIIFFPKNNVVHMGDDFVRYGFPFIDVSSGGSVQGMIDAMEKATAQLTADVKVIPGHGALSNLDDVRAFTKMLKETSAVVQKAIDEHKTVDQMKQEKILAPWAKWSGEFLDADKFIETLYNSLTGSKGEFLKHN